MNALLRTSRPFAHLVDQFFDDGFFAPSTAQRLGEGNERSFSPAVDLSQSEEEYRIQVDLPGLAKGDLSLTVEDDSLTLSGERTFTKTAEGESFNRIERTFGKFSRTFQLPANADSSKVTAAFENGVLTIALPKREEAKPREIEVQ
ncbi:MAG: Hsp20/alpha crystallin family protein [Acidobacteriota bacterium]